MCLWLAHSLFWWGQVSGVTLHCSDCHFCRTNGQCYLLTCPHQSKRDLIPWPLDVPGTKRDNLKKRKRSTSWSNCSFSAFISEVGTEHICRVLSIPSDPFQEKDRQGLYCMFRPFQNLQATQQNLQKSVEELDYSWSIQNCFPPWFFFRMFHHVILFCDEREKKQRGPIFASFDTTITWAGGKTEWKILAATVVEPRLGARNNLYSSAVWQYVYQWIQGCLIFTSIAPTKWYVRDAMC